MPGDDPGVWDVVLQVGSELKHAPVVRAAVAAAAATGGFGIDDIDDLRLLADEVFVTLCDLGAIGVCIRVAVDVGELVLDISGTRVGAMEQPRDLRIVAAVADVVADSWSSTLGEGCSRFSATFRSHP